MSADQRLTNHRSADDVDGAVNKSSINRHAERLSAALNTDRHHGQSESFSVLLFSVWVCSVSLNLYFNVFVTIDLSLLLHHRCRIILQNISACSEHLLKFTKKLFKRVKLLFYLMKTNIMHIIIFSCTSKIYIIT